MIDWLTLILDRQHLSVSDLQVLESKTDLIIRVTQDGEERSKTGLWERLRSDTQGLTYRLNDRELTITGSPASAISPNNVFGTNDILQAFNDMLSFFADATHTEPPRNPILWRCTRIDYTQNYHLGGQVAVNQALDYFSRLPTRGNNVTVDRGTAYWNQRSKLRKGKGYNKYQHALYSMDKKTALYTPEQLELLKGILRLELQIGRQYFNKYGTKWYNLTEQLLQNEHAKFFESVLINNIEVPRMDNLLDKLIEVSPTEGQARSALQYLHTIKAMGSKTARSMTPDRTHYRHIKNLKAAGLTQADIQSGEILHFRPKFILMEPVNCWEDIATKIA